MDSSSFRSGFMRREREGGGRRVKKKFCSVYCGLRIYNMKGDAEF